MEKTHETHVCSDMTGPGIQAKQIYVWDPMVRASHWVLVAAFAIAFLGAEDKAEGPSGLHVWGGYLIAVIVTVRILWGFIGPRYARFSDFVRGPFATLSYMADLFARRARRYVGHSPAGGAMTIALLVSLAMTVSPGILSYDGPGIGSLVNATSVVATAVSSRR